MSCHAVIDTNVLIAALLAKRKDSATVRILEAIPAGIIIPLFNDAIIEEYTDVLHRDKFPLQKATRAGMIRIVKQFGLPVAPVPTGKILPDMDDLIFYETALALPPLPCREANTLSSCPA